MRTMYALFAKMPLFVLVSFGLLVQGKRGPALTRTEVENQLRAIVILVDLLPSPATSFEATLARRIEAWLQGMIDDLSARLALIDANVLLVGTVPCGHDPSIERRN